MQRFSTSPQISRRGFLVSGAAGLASVRGFAATPSCVLISEQEEGPYYVNGARFRADITEGHPGVPIMLRVALVDAKRCTPLANAALDIWHCDASGVYSGFTSNSPDGFGRGPGGRGGPGPDPGPGMPPPPMGMPPFGGGRGRGATDATRFLRGLQITDAKGLAGFNTLYPGWYAGRAIHIHLKVHLGGEEASERYSGGHVSHTGQLFFPEEATERIAGMEPYAKRMNVHRTTQEEDGIFQSQHGGASIVKLERISARSESEGYIATVTLAIDPDATPKPVGGRGGRPGRGPAPFDR